ncbi:MAG TPA: histidine phosphatase family protein [Candidatus Binataceae bacterium]|nr:histidine phosphatase family protein [Candidatus Binataceae bacterium]
MSIVSPGPARLLLVRHAEAEWNQSGRYQGRSESRLSPRGEEQAQALANRLATSGVVAIVASPLRRASETAQIVARRLGLAVVTDNHLLELAYGEWEGLSQPEVKLRWPKMLRLWKTAPEQVTFSSGESLKDVCERVRSFLASAAAQAGPLLVVTHDAVVRVAVLEARAEPLSEFRRVRVENASITTLVRQGNRFTVERINDVGHLEGGGVQPRRDPSGASG